MGKIMHGGISYSGGGGSGGASAMSELTDVEFSNLSNGQILKYDSVNQKWENGNETQITITPTFSGGIKIADFSIGGVTGELYAPQGGNSVISVSSSSFNGVRGNIIDSVSASVSSEIV